MLNKKFLKLYYFIFCFNLIFLLFDFKAYNFISEKYNLLFLGLFLGYSFMGILYEKYTFYLKKSYRII